MRLDYQAVAADAVAPLYAAAKVLAKSTLERELRCLVQVRASQINGCAFCLALHAREGDALGISLDRLMGVAAWQEASWYSDRERAALAWTEALTLVAQTHVPDDVYDEVRAVFTDRELADLTLAVTVINSWNRFAIAFRTPPEAAEAVFRRLQAFANA